MATPHAYAVLLYHDILYHDIHDHAHYVAGPVARK